MQSRRRGWDGQDYTYAQFMEWYGEESAMEFWRAVDTPGGATQPVAAAPTTDNASDGATQPVAEAPTSNDPPVG